MEIAKIPREEGWEGRGRWRRRERAEEGDLVGAEAERGNGREEGNSGDKQKCLSFPIPLRSPVKAKK